MPSVPRMSIISMMVRGALEYTLRGPHCQCSPSRVGWFQRQAYPLMYRTWIYHDTIVKVSKIGQSHDENGVLRHVLSQRCIDAPINGGRSSPLMCLACGGGGHVLPRLPPQQSTSIRSNLIDHALRCRQALVTTHHVCMSRAPGPLPTALACGLPSVCTCTE